MARYTIDNTHGITGGPWSRVYSDLATALEALRNAMGWGLALVSHDYDTANGGTAWSVYETEADRDADVDGAKAPRILKAPTRYTITLGGGDTLSADSLSELQQQLSDAGYDGPSLRAYDDHGFGRGWVSAGHWRYAQ